MGLKTLRRVLLTFGAGAMLVAMAAVVPATATAAPPGPRYTFTTINVPGAAWTFPAAANDFGAVVGWYTTSASETAPTYGFIEQGGHFTTINGPAALACNSTQATGVNDLGVVTGYCYDASGVGHGFTYIHGQYTTIDDPYAGTPLSAGQGTFPWGENLLGVVAGTYIDSSGVWHGFTYQGGHFTTINAPSAGTTPNEGQGTFIGFINDLGELTGGVNINGGPLPSYWFVDNHGHYTTTINDPSGVVNGTSVGSVNDFGLIAGDFADSSGSSNGFVLSNGTYTTIDDSLAVTGAYLGTTVQSSNNLGMVVGYYVASDGLYNGFEATPSH
jgi:hypothetical protein